MATKLFRYEGKTYRLDAELSNEEALAKIRSHLGREPSVTSETTEQPQSSNQTPELSTGGFDARYQDVNPDESIYDADLIADPDFVAASKIMYQMNVGDGQQKLNIMGVEQDVDLTPKTDEEFAKWGLDFMGWFNWNLPKMTVDAARITNADDEQKRAMLYLMESTEDLGASWAGTGRMVRGLASDPTTWFGLTSFGITTIAGQAGKQVTKMGLKEILKGSVSAGVVAGTEAAVYSAVDDINRQVVETAVSGENIDLVRTGKQAIIGGVVGFGVGSAADSAITGVRKAFTKEAPKPRVEPKIVEGAEEAANINAAPAMPEPVAKAAETPVQRIRTQLDSVVKKIKKEVPAGKIPGADETGRQSLEELAAVGAEISEVLGKAAKRNPDEIAPALMEAELTPGQLQALGETAQQTISVIKERQAALITQRDATKDVEQIKAIDLEIRELDKLAEPLDDLDVALSAVPGQMLRARQQNTNIGEVRGVTIESLEATGMSRKKAEAEFVRRIEKAQKDTEMSAEIKKLDAQIDEKITAGDYSGAQVLKRQKKQLVDEKVALEVNKGIAGKAYENFNRYFIRPLNELFIGNVFSFSTTIVNIVPSMIKAVYKPMINGLVRDGISRAAFRSTVAEYSAMWSMRTMAAKAALAAFRYERSILTGDTARFLEEQTVIPKNMSWLLGSKVGKYIPLGGAVRFFPRVLLATDAFFETIVYRGYIVGNNVSKAVEDGIEKGLKGKELDDFIDEQLDKALKKAYKYDESSAIEMLIEEATGRGLRGKDVTRFVKKELAKNKDLMVNARNQEGKDYVQDFLFKREFSGEGVSSAFRLYERAVNKVPAIRLMGQLFFRTPVRVFEEGFRLTPGLNLVTPKFLNDLRGKNGQMRQVRAHGELMLSYTFLGAIFSLYSTGSITGSQGNDYKQRRQGENAGRLGAYQIRMPDGTAFSYRNFDPFATPIKILVNALEGMEMLEYRRSQGEVVTKYEEQEYVRYAHIALMSVFNAVRDANLFAGVDAMLELGEDLTKEDYEGELVKFFGQKMQTFIPNSYFKLKLQNDPILADPATFDQYWEYRHSPGSSRVPSQYTALGRKRVLSNPGASLYVFDPETQEERNRGVPDKELKVEDFLYKLSRANDVNFQAGYKRPELPGVDLRKHYTKDGKETLYDRYQRYVHESGVVDALAVVADANMTVGTPSQPGLAIRQTREILNNFRKAAFLKLMSDEALIGSFSQGILNKAQGLRGDFDQNNIPFNR